MHIFDKLDNWIEQELASYNLGSVYSLAESAYGKAILSGLQRKIASLKNESPGSHAAMDNKIPNCPACGSKAVRDDSITSGVEGAVRCTECTFAALISDWMMLNDACKCKDQVGYKHCGNCGKLVQ